MSNYKNTKELEAYLDTVDINIVSTISEILSSWQHGFNNFKILEHDEYNNDITFSWCIFDGVSLVVEVVHDDLECKPECTVYIEGNLCEFLYKLSCTEPDYDNIDELTLIRKIPFSDPYNIGYLERIINCWCTKYNNFYTYYKYCPIDDNGTCYLNWKINDRINLNIIADVKEYTHATTLTDNPYNISNIIKYLSEAY